MYEDLKKYSIFNQLIKTFKNINEVEKELEQSKNTSESVKIEPKIIYDKFSDILKIEIRIGMSTFYRVKSLPEFYTRFLNRERYKYGSKLEFVHTIDNFEEESRGLLK